MDEKHFTQKALEQTIEDAKRRSAVGERTGRRAKAAIDQPRSERQPPGGFVTTQHQVVAEPPDIHTKLSRVNCEAIIANARQVWKDARQMQVTVQQMRTIALHMRTSARTSLARIGSQRGLPTAEAIS
jgi:hypothetical protein